MRVLASLLFAGSLVLNGLANRLPLNGKTTGELSAQYPNLFVPAGVTFSIWGVIYLLLMAWAVAQFLPGPSSTGRRVAPWFALASILNGTWIVAWHYEFVPLSVGIMLGLLGVLLYLNSLLVPGLPGQGAQPSHRLARAAFGVYLGWISVATIANVTALFVSVGWGGGPLSDAAWASGMVVVGGAAGGFAMGRLRNPFLGLAVVWALAGIVLNRKDDVVFVAGAAALVAGVLALLTLRELVLEARR